MTSRALWSALVTVFGVVAFIVCAPWATASERGSAPPAIPVGVGEIVKVAGTPIACAVRRDAKQRAFDCRRLGPLAGTYGTLLTRTRVLVVRFHDDTTGTVVFSARHGSARARTCDGMAS
jgi:hypothetical protein